MDLRPFRAFHFSNQTTIMALSKIKMPKGFTPSLTCKPMQPKGIKVNQYRSTLSVNTSTPVNITRNISSQQHILTKLSGAKYVFVGQCHSISKSTTTLIAFQNYKKQNNNHNNGDRRNFSSSKKSDDEDPLAPIYRAAPGFAFAESLTSGYAWIIVAGIIIGVLFLNPVTQVPAGHVGVIDLFGSVSDRVLDPGLHIVNPLARVFFCSCTSYCF